MRDCDDWIEDVPHMEVGGLGHGADPVSPAFGARMLSADGAVGHTGYFVPGTDSLDNFAGIAAGSYGTVDCASSDPGCLGAASLTRRRRADHAAVPHALRTVPGESN